VGRRQDWADYRSFTRCYREDHPHQVAAKDWWMAYRDVWQQWGTRHGRRLKCGCVKFMGRFVSYYLGPPPCPEAHWMTGPGMKRMIRREAPADRADAIRQWRSLGDLATGPIGSAEPPPYSPGGVNHDPSEPEG
jgi:hypothetical protein